MPDIDAIVSALANQDITAVTDQAPLRLRIDQQWLLTIEGTITVQCSCRDCPPATATGDDATHVELLAGQLQGKRIKTATLDSGVLWLRFSDDATIGARPDPDYESWSLVGPAQQRVVCTPGGELAVWPAAM